MFVDKMIYGNHIVKAGIALITCTIPECYLTYFRRRLVRGSQFSAISDVVLAALAPFVALQFPLIVAQVEFITRSA